MGLTGRRAGPIAVVVLAAACLLAGPAVAAPAPAPAPDKQKQAQDLAQQLEDQGQRIAMLDEQFNQARARAEALGAELASMGPKIAESDQRLAAARQRLAGASVDSYVRGGSAPLLGLLIKARADDLGVRKTYADAALDTQRSALKEFETARRRLLAARDQLRVTERSARATAATLEANRRAAEATISSQQQALSRAQGDMAPLVQQAAAEKAARNEQAGKDRFNTLAAPPPPSGTAPQPRRQPGSPPTTARPSSPTTAARSGSPPPTTAAPKPAPAPTGPIPPVKSGASAAVNTAKAQLGKPYVYGGAGPDNFDCSGLTMYAWRAGGVGLPHSAEMQYAATAHIPLSALAPGDLVFYGSPIYHEGIYVGGGQMIEAPHTGAVVRYASIYRSDLVGASRP